MKVLVTGATGFIGSNVARALASAGADVVCLVRAGSSRQKLAGATGSIAYIEGDLARIDDLAAELGRARIETCVHLAWFVVPGEYLASPKNVDMLTWSLRLATLLADSGCKRFVGVGTNFEYESSAGYPSESTPLAPASLYAASKVSLFHMLEALSRVRGFTHAWARIFYEYGPHEDPRRLVPAVILPLLRGERARTSAGAQVRDFLHVEDVGRAIAAIATSEVTGAVNVGSGVPVTVRDLVLTIADRLGGRASVDLGALPYRPGDPMFVCANTEKLRGSTSFVPKYDLRSGIEQTVEWWRKA